MVVFNIYSPLIESVHLLFCAIKNLFIIAVVLSSDGLAGIPIILDSSTTMEFTT